MAYSSDGTIWTTVPDSTFGTNNINSITYGGGKFIALGGVYDYNLPSEKMAYSSDGISWTQVTAPSSIYEIAYGNGKFVAVGGQSYFPEIWYSSDGINWTKAIHTFNFDHGFNVIAYGGDKFVAGSYDKLAYSTDGINWTAVTNSTVPKYHAIDAIAYGNGTFVAVGSYNSVKCSSDGITWKTYAEGKAGFFNAIAYGNGKFVAGDSLGWYMPTSSDGITWLNGSSIFPSSGYEHVNAIAFGNNRFVAVGAYGKIAYSD
jgi:photosystem II stability/assembly factor-like uncharacterized protein